MIKGFFQIIDGDYKFLFNTRIRLPIIKSLSTALFFDAGNICTKDTLLFGTAGKLSKNWYKELAVTTGVGLRYDEHVLIIRVDMGIPLRKPYFKYCAGLTFLSTFNKKYFEEIYKNIFGDYCSVAYWRIYLLAAV